MEIINSVEVRHEFEDLDDLLGYLNSLLNDECDPDTGTYDVKDIIYFAREYRNYQDTPTILIKTIIPSIPYGIQRSLESVLMKNMKCYFSLLDICRTERGCVIVLMKNAVYKN